MNTKHTRVVVTLILAVAALATMGFSADYENNRAASIMPDHITCELVDPSLSAIEMLEVIDTHCSSDLLDSIEIEIGWGLGGRLSTDALIGSILDRSRATGSGMSEYLELLESETDAFASSWASPARRSSAGDEWSIDYHNPSSPWADSEQIGAERRGATSEWSIDYHNPSSAWADSE